MRHGTVDLAGVLRINSLQRVDLLSGGTSYTHTICSLACRAESSSSTFASWAKPWKPLSFATGPLRQMTVATIGTQSFCLYSPATCGNAIGVDLCDEIDVSIFPIGH